MCACVDTQCCEFPHLIEVPGGRVCENCGLEDIDPYFEHEEPRIKDHEGHYVRATERTSPETFYRPSTISRHNKDYRGRSLDDEAKFQRLRVIDTHYVTNAIRNLLSANSIRTRLLSALGFTDPRKISLQIIKWVARTQFSQGRTLEATTAAAVYVAGREQNFPVTYEQIGEHSHVRIRHLRRLVSLYLAGGLATTKFPVKLTRKRFFMPDRRIRKLCDDLQIAPSIASLAEELAQSVEARLPTGARPGTKAAIFVNATCGGIIPWCRLSRAVGIAIHTLKEYWKRVEHIVEGIQHNRPPADEAVEGEV